MNIYSEFPSSYIIDVHPEWSGNEENIQEIACYHRLGMHTGLFLTVKFALLGEPGWTVRFEQSERGDHFENAILTTPEMNCACVIVGGAGYWVDVALRKVTNLQYLPITKAIVSLPHQLILIATWADLFAHRAAEAEWSLTNLFADRLRILEIRGECICLEGFNGGIQKIDINLVKGTILSVGRMR